MPEVKSKAQLGLMLSSASPLNPKQKAMFKTEIKGKKFGGLPEHVAKPKGDAEEKGERKPDNESAEVDYKKVSKKLAAKAK